MRIVHYGTSEEIAARRAAASPPPQEQLAIIWRALFELRGEVIFSPEVQAMIDAMAALDARFQITEPPTPPSPGGTLP